MQLVLGGKGLSRGVLECKDRRTGEKGELPVDALETALPQSMEGVREAWAERQRSRTADGGAPACPLRVNKSASCPSLN